ncbi:Peroxidase [Geosmithia morbida]|uniref:Peroxidase n=1 Tax=Geosmithia morbida TaxID=1094350 RepID=A0A9P5D156_9HYPO|nr:Peroxidase [Geosmithia morbida]KAF4120106.1 Peroxidase [Geosmithia morbida]
MKISTTTGLVGLAPLAAASQLVWPSKWDELEDLYTMMSGYGKRGFADALTTCEFGTFIPGRQNSAEWIRTAFHDAVTHNVEAGTGGLDASIYFELDRPENPGSAFNNTFGFFSGFHNARATASDLTALGLVVATGACEGPKVPFRAGRVDAYQEGPPGVPEPSTNLKDTFATFTKAGFTKEDMTAMVACGHAIGGVHSADFPDVTGIKADPNNDTTVHFQEDVSRFHNGVVTEFLSGTTKNPLVVASNDTLNSDKRIFDNDRATMEKLSSTEEFNSMCADVFARMIDTVPSSVKLTDVIDPYDVKPYVDELSLDSEGELHFTGSIRFSLSAASGRDANDLSVELVYADRSGETNATIPTTHAMWQGGLGSGYFGNFVSVEFDTTINAEKGISNFWIKETTPSTNITKTHDNQNTGGYKVDDTVLYQLSESCFEVNKVSTGAAPIVVTAMVRDERASDPLTLAVTKKLPIQGVIVPKLQVETTNFEPTGKKLNGWTAFQANTTVASQNLRFDIALGGEKPAGVEFQNSNLMPEQCS